MLKKSQFLPPAFGMLPGGRVLAAPSWVMSGTLVENCCFLAGKVDEVGLLFLETEACLAYTEQDLPDELASLPLTWHVHLPVDLIWDGDRAVETCLELMDKAAFLGAERAVLHPPATSLPHTEKLLAAFAAHWAGAGRAAGCVLLENTVQQNLLELAGCIEGCGFQTCLDLGHMLAYKQKDISEFLPLAARAGMVHLNSLAEPDSGRHGPLADLDAAGRACAQRLCSAVPRNAVIMVELFSWNDIVASLPLVRTWLGDAGFLPAPQDQAGV